jgi:hypothetical protein
VAMKRPALYYSLAGRDLILCADGSTFAPAARSPPTHLPRRMIRCRWRCLAVGAVLELRGGDGAARQGGHHQDAWLAYSASSVRVVQRKMICRHEASSTRVVVRSKCSYPP